VRGVRTDSPADLDLGNLWATCQCDASNALVAGCNVPRNRQLLVMYVCVMPAAQAAAANGGRLCDGLMPPPLCR